MNAVTRNFRAITSLALVGAVVSVVGLPARAAEPARVAHRALRDKILRDAGDRYDVRFLSTHLDRTSPVWRIVTGSGRFRRHGKSPQKFTYHSTVNTRNGNERDTGYNIQ